MNVSRLSLAAKLWCAQAIMIALLLATLLISIGRSTSLTNEQDVISAKQAEKIYKVSLWVGMIETNVARVAASVVSADPTVGEMFREQIPNTIKQITEVQSSIEKMDMSSEGRTLFNQIGENRKVVLTSLARANALKKEGNQSAAVQEVNQSFLPAIDKYLSNLKVFAESQSKDFEAMNAQFVEQRASNSNFAKAMVAVLLICMVGGNIYLIRLIRTPLQHAIEVANNIADGDLTTQVDVVRQDEFGEMMRAIAHMRDRLLHLVSDVRAGTVNITTASEEIAVGNHDLADRTEHTASNLQSTASSMAELMTNVQHSSDSASHANQLAASAAEVAGRGGEVVGRVVSTMKEINTSSHRISEIISAIDGIAFQTNILALNAAVEAARAGEQGRGFAVVASEVRSLAGRSAEAAKEIKVLINTSLEKVDDGTRLVDAAGETMTEIVSSVNRVSDIIGEISAGATEQVSGISRVNTAISELDQMTQQNSALVEQSAAAAMSMKDQAQRLSQIVAQFKIDPKTGGNLPPGTLKKAEVKNAVKALTANTTKAMPPAKQFTSAPKTTPKPALAPVKASAARPPAPAAAAVTEEWESF